MADMTARIKVEGLGEFRSAMKSAASAVKETTAAEKLADAQFKKTGDAAAYQQQKTDALRQRLEAQRKAVDTARQACEKLQKAGVAPDDSRLRTWRTELLNAQAAVAATEAQLQSASRAAGTFGEKILQAARNAGKGYDFISAQQALKNVDEAMSGVVEKAAGLGKAVWSTATEAAAKADALLTQATQTGLSTETLQEWAYAAQFVDTEVSTIIQARTRLTKAMKSGEALDIGGVAVSTKGRGWEDVFWDAVDALGRMTDETARDQAAMDLFGKSFADMIPLIEAGRDAWEAYGREAHQAGAVMSEEQVRALGAFDDALNRMNASTGGLVNTFMAGLAPGMETVADAVRDASSAMSAWLNSAEGKATMAELSGAIGDVVRALSANMPAALQMVTNAFKSLGSAVQWLGEHTGAVMAFFEILAGVKIANTLISIVESFKQIGMFMLGNPLLVAVIGIAAGALMLADHLANAVAETSDLAKQMGNLKAKVNMTNAAQLTEEVNKALSAADEVKQIRVQVHAQYEEGYGLVEDAAKDGKITRSESNAILDWVKKTIDPDLQAAEAYCAQCWADAYNAAYVPPFMGKDQDKPETTADATAYAVMTAWVSTTMGTDYETALSNANGMWLVLSAAAGGEGAVVPSFKGLPEGAVYDAMVQYIMKTMGVDKPAAEQMAQKLWSDLQTVASAPAQEMSDPYASAAGSEGANPHAKQILTNYIIATMGLDAEQAAAKADEYWNTVLDHLQGNGSGKDEANEAALDSVRQNKIAQTMTELHEVRNNITTALAEIEAAGNNATQEQLNELMEYMRQAEILQGRLDILMSDTMKLGEGAYNAVINGRGREGDVAKAVGYVQGMYELERSEAETSLQAAENKRLEAEASGDPKAAAAALADYDRELARYTATMDRLDIEKANRLSMILGAQSGMNPEQIKGTTAFADAAAAVLGAEGQTLKGISAAQWEALVPFLPDSLSIGGFQLNQRSGQQLYDMFGENGKYAANYGEHWQDVAPVVLESLNSVLGEGESPLMTSFQGLLDGGAFEGLDWSQATGALALGFKLNLLASDEFDASQYNAIGANVPEGTAVGIENNTGRAVAAATGMARAVKDAVKKELEIQSPSRVMAQLGGYTAEGLARGIDESLAAVDAAAVRMAQAVTVPVSESAAGAAGAGSVSNTSALYIGTYNQHSGDDVQDLAAKLAALDRQSRQGFGSRR